VRLEVLGKWKKYNDLFGNQTRDIPACTIVPQSTTLQLAPYSGNDPDPELYQGGYRFESLWYTNNFEVSLWFSIISPGKQCDNNSTRPRLFPSVYFPIKKPWIIPPRHATHCRHGECHKVTQKQDISGHQNSSNKRRSLKGTNTV
jgi:hypothetical protein